MQFNLMFENHINRIGVELLNAYQDKPRLFIKDICRSCTQSWGDKTKCTL